MFFLFHMNYSFFIFMKESKHYKISKAYKVFCKKERKNKHINELIVFLTPYIVRNESGGTCRRHRSSSQFLPPASPSRSLSKVIYFNVFIF